MADHPGGGNSIYGRYTRHLCDVLLYHRTTRKFVQELLGHATIAITPDTYSHMLPGMGGEAVDATGEVLETADRLTKFATYSRSNTGRSTVR